MESADAFRELQETCLTDGLVKRGFGGELRITKKGRELVKLAAISDEEVASALQDALRTPWRDRGSTFVSLVHFARSRLPMRDS